MALDATLACKGLSPVECAPHKAPRMKGQSGEKLLKVDRRTLLIGGGVGVGLIVGWGTWRWTGRPRGAPEQSFGPYVKIGRDGRVIVAVPQTETGQGIWTALPQLVA